jgi:hypothetical protein
MLSKIAITAIGKDDIFSPRPLQAEQGFLHARPAVPKSK